MRSLSILLAEDDPIIGAGIREGLQSQGCNVTWVLNGLDAVRKAQEDPAINLLILDLALPGLGGLELLAKLRAGGSNIPVLIVTAQDGVTDRITGLNLGADDYMVKPFNLDEMVARIHAILRRGKSNDDELRAGGLRLIPASRTVMLEDEPVALSGKEYSLLLVLMENPGVVVPMRQIESRMFGTKEDIASNAVEVHLHNLRKKLGVGWIRNVRGVGYKLAAPD